MDDRIRALMHERHIPGLSLAVVKNGDVMAATGYGLADVERKVPANKNTV